jgi:hypothetical protein
VSVKMKFFREKACKRSHFVVKSEALVQTAKLNRRRAVVIHYFVNKQKVVAGGSIRLYILNLCVYEMESS